MLTAKLRSRQILPADHAVADAEHGFREPDHRVRPPRDEAKARKGSERGGGEREDRVGRSDENLGDEECERAQKDH